MKTDVNMSILNNWNTSKTSVFWGEIAPCDHVVQIYEDNNVFLDVLAGFVGNGINSGESTIIIATDEHLAALDARLRAHGVHVDALISSDQYIPLNAEETLATFMVNDWPDEELFQQTVRGLIKRAQVNNRKVRAFGEMVAILWAKGHNGATVHLEHLWNQICAEEALCLFCAYPKAGFTKDARESVMHICGAHSRIIDGGTDALTEVQYTDKTEVQVPKKIAS
jgi:hypothetical protein